MKSERPKLKPCPFCGNRSIVNEWDASDGVSGILLMVRCFKCKATGPQYYLPEFKDSEVDKTAKRAAKAWNQRK